MAVEVYSKILSELIGKPVFVRLATNRQVNLTEATSSRIPQ
jgi:hypothetical protein